MRATKDSRAVARLRSLCPPVLVPVLVPRMALGLALGLGLGLVGCSSEGSDAGTSEESTFKYPGTSQTRVPELVIEPITGATDYAATPRSLWRSPRLEDAIELSTASRSREGAEQFAALFLQLQMDADSDADTEEMVAALVSDSTPEAVKNYILQDRYENRYSGFGRHYVTTAPAWLRSAATGPDEAPETVIVELAGDFRSKLHRPDQRSFIVSQAGVGWDKDRWVVTQYSAGTVGARPIAPEDLIRDVLDGPGWRELAVPAQP